MTVKVYEVRFDPTFQYFLLSDRSQVPRLRFDGNRLSNWTPPKVFSYEPHLPEGDFWSVELGLGIFAARPEVAKEAWHLLDDAGQLLPLPYGGREFQILNVTETANCLDHGRSEILTSPATGAFTRIERYAFHVDRLPESSIFKIPETRRSTVYCYEGVKEAEDEFKPYVQRHGLRGLEFVEIWNADLQPPSATDRRWRDDVYAVNRTELPATLAALAEWLDAHGFEQNLKLTSNSMGGLMLGWTNPAVWVRMIRDRDQWFLDISRPELGEWFGLDSWRALLDGDSVNRTMLSEHHVAELARSVIPRVESLETSNETLRKQLAELGRVSGD